MFAERLKKLRNEKGLTQVDVALAINISSRGYQGLEADAKPQYDTIGRLADFFDVSVDWLMGRTDRRDVNR